MSFDQSGSCDVAGWLAESESSPSTWQAAKLATRPATAASTASFEGEELRVARWTMLLRALMTTP